MAFVVEVNCCRISLFFLQYCNSLIGEGLALKINGIKLNYGLFNMGYITMMPHVD